MLHSKRTESSEEMLQTQEENFVYTLTAIEKPKREDVPLIGKVCSGKKCVIMTHAIKKLPLVHIHDHAIIQRKRSIFFLSDDGLICWWKST